jgi:hypothetical protein
LALALLAAHGATGPVAAQRSATEMKTLERCGPVIEKLNGVAKAVPPGTLRDIACSYWKTMRSWPS